MAINAEQLNIILSAQTKDLRQELDKAQKRIKGFESKSKKDLKSTSASFDMLASAAKRVGPAIAAALSVQAFRGALDAASEIQNLSNIAGVASDRFQVLALTSQQFGINQEKLADILKDVNDKFGDYVQTGAGPLADFFENIAPQVGITASAFADLSSEGKLGAYINALQRANVSQADMTFYMEAIASDSTALVRAFENNSAAIDQMARKAEDLGLIIDQETIAKSKEAKNELDLMAKILNVEVTQALLSVAPLAIQAASAIASISAEISSFLSFGSRLAAMANQPLDGPEELRARADELGGLEREYSKYFQTLSAYNANVEKYGEASEQAIDWAKQLASAEGDLEAAIAAKQERMAAEARSVSGIQSIASETKALQEQAELQAMSAKDAERRRIATQRNAYEQSILNDITASGREITDKQFDDVMKLGELWEQAAVSASKILNPVEKAGSATRSLKTSVEEASEKMAELSPLLQKLGFDADSLVTVSNAIEGSMEQAFMSIVDGTMSAKDAFRSMAADIIKELYRVLVVQRLVGMVSNAVSLFSGPAPGSTASILGRPRAAASGRSMQAGQPHVVGEHGRELFVPQTAGRVLSVAQAQNAVGGGGAVVVNQTINVSTGVQQTVRAEIKQLMPQIAESAKTAVVDAKRRGGSYGRAFS